MYVVSISFYGITRSLLVTCSSVESSSNEVPDVFVLPKPVLYAALLISLEGQCIIVTR